MLKKISLLSSAVVLSFGFNIDELISFYDKNPIELFTGCKYEKTNQGYQLEASCPYKGKNGDDRKIVFVSIVNNEMVKSIPNEKQKDLINDPHAIFPVAKGLSQIFPNYKFSTVSNTDEIFGAIELYVDEGTKSLKPRKKITGDISRSLYHLEQEYGINIGIIRDRKLLELWRTADPVDDFEFAKNKFLKEKTGKINDFISTY